MEKLLHVLVICPTTNMAARADQAIAVELFGIIAKELKKKDKGEWTHLVIGSEFLSDLVFGNQSFLDQWINEALAKEGLPLQVKGKRGIGSLGPVLYETIVKNIQEVSGGIVKNMTAIGCVKSPLIYEIIRQ